MTKATEIAERGWNESDEAALSEGRADHATGRTISHAAVMAWIVSWGADDELPTPKIGD